MRYCRHISWLGDTCMQPLKNTCLEFPMYPHTEGVAFHRYNIVVCYISSELLWKGDGSCSQEGGGSVPVDKVGVGWVYTIVNGAGIPWLEKCALHNHSGCISHVNMYIKDVSIYAACGGRWMTWQNLLWFYCWQHMVTIARSLRATK